MPEKRLLICDDEADFAEFVRAVAEPMGYEVRIVTRSTHFSDAYDAFNPGVVMLDMVMPDMGGNEILSWLSGKGATARILLVTGFNPEYATMARTIGEANGLLQVSTIAKPVGIEALRQALA